MLAIRQKPIPLPTDKPQNASSGVREKEETTPTKKIYYYGYKEMGLPRMWVCL